MWRSASSASRFLLRSLVASSLEHTRLLPAKRPIQPFAALLSSSAAPSPSADAGGGSSAADPITLAEAKRLMRLVNVEALKRKLGQDGEEMIGYARLLDACERLGVARSREEAAAFARVLDEAGVVLLFRDKVCLHPDKVVDLVRRAVPFALTTENDPRREELQQLQKKKEELDALAHKQVRRILWSGLGFLIFQISIFFRLTFWEFSWDVMEPITFFATTAGLLAGYAYFLFTSRDPTYQDLMMSLVLSRQRKLYKKHQFNLARYNELQKHRKNPLDRIVVKYNEQKLVSSRSD